MAKVEQAFGKEWATKIDSAVQECAAREQLYEGVYADVYWSLFVSKIHPSKVVRNFQERLAYLEGMKRVKASKHDNVTKGLLDTEWDRRR